MDIDEFEEAVRDLIGEDYIEVAECPACGFENTPMGSLGNRAHYNCRACGWVYSDQMIENSS